MSRQERVDRYRGHFSYHRTYAPARYFRPKRPTLKQSQILVFRNSCVSIVSVTAVSYLMNIYLWF
ncbi:MAG: hypothetical protein F6K22_20825 [Okeania sp. SIO2F4]|uniref:hypothetical protein n=1 Tax=Okeania sp. SIO2F4 TaxID=2607790 RepID=UPI00142BF171|nr:hypothetical protein [Okeania sp. SIO2F4]NES05053.1 hypothetical protein [Okeania sp. SIO2F4]